MSNDFFKQYLDAQKTMFEDWQNQMKTVFAGQELPEGMKFNPVDYYTKLFETSQDFWSKVNEGSKSYHAIFELWKSLSEKKATLDPEAASELYDTWSKQHFGLIRDSLIPMFPDNAREIAEKYLSTLETSGGVMIDQFKDWTRNDTSLKEAFTNALGKGPKGFIDFLEAWQQSYEESYGKIVKAPTYGKDMDFWLRQKSSFDRFIKSNVATAKFYTSLVDIAQDATKRVFDEYVEMQGQGTQPKTFDDFYKYWSKTVSKAYEKVLLSEEISTLAGNMVNEMSKFKIEHDKLCEIYLASMPVPKKSDMDNLYKTVHDLKLELRALKREMKANAKAGK